MYEWWVYWHPVTCQQVSAGDCCVQGFSDIGPELVGQLTVQLDPKTSWVGVVECCILR